MGICDPMTCAFINFENSLAIAHQNMTDSAEINGITAQDDIIINVRKQEEMRKLKLIQTVESDEKWSTILEHASRKNASTWLTTMPRKRFG
ncbi:hypothetical protein GJ496_007277 [Pomphorhynchus laevis]|nr:hypothetical protein GJ496_007277 [Pomphorhynchus laevis]